MTCPNHLATCFFFFFFFFFYIAPSIAVYRQMKPRQSETLQLQRGIYKSPTKARKAVCPSSQESCETCNESIKDCRNAARKELIAIDAC
jgi:hypothetical protein